MTVLRDIWPAMQGLAGDEPINPQVPTDWERSVVQVERQQYPMLGPISIHENVTAQGISFEVVCGVFAGL